MGHEPGHRGNRPPGYRPPLYARPLPPHLHPHPALSPHPLRGLRRRRRPLRLRIPRLHAPILDQRPNRRRRAPAYSVRLQPPLSPGNHGRPRYRRTQSSSGANYTRVYTGTHRPVLQLRLRNRFLLRKPRKPQGLHPCLHPLQTLPPDLPHRTLPPPPPTAASFRRRKPPFPGRSRLGRKIRRRELHSRVLLPSAPRAQPSRAPASPPGAGQNGDL